MTDTEAERIVQAYGRHIEQNASAMQWGLPTATLPYPKHRIREALRHAYMSTLDQQQIDTIGCCYIDLSSFQDEFPGPVPMRDGGLPERGDGMAEAARRGEIMKAERDQLSAELGALEDFRAETIARLLQERPAVATSAGPVPGAQPLRPAVQAFDVGSRWFLRGAILFFVVMLGLAALR